MYVYAARGALLAAPREFDGRKPEWARYSLSGVVLGRNNPLQRAPTPCCGVAKNIHRPLRYRSPGGMQVQHGQAGTGAGSGAARRGAEERREEERRGEWCRRGLWGALGVLAVSHAARAAMRSREWRSAEALFRRYVSTPAATATFPWLSPDVCMFERPGRWSCACVASGVRPLGAAKQKLSRSLSDPKGATLESGRL